MAFSITVFVTYIGGFSSLAQLGASSQPSKESSGHEGGVTIHIHSKIQIFIDGRQVGVPGNIGIDAALWKGHALDHFGAHKMSPLHTHDDTGIVHMESTVTRSFTLAEFFEVWGMRFDEKCVLDKCSESKLLIIVNGVKNEEYGRHVLKDGETVQIFLDTGRNR